MTTHVVDTSAIHRFKNLFITFSFAFFKSETLCIMHNEVYEEERERISPQIHRSVLKLLQKNTRSMQAQEDEAHDVPNSVLKHITLENNENKPVTNSRGTQEVKLEQGLKIVKIFKEHTSKICILNDFSFYEVRQKTILEKKAKQQQTHKQVSEENSTEDEKKKSETADPPHKESPPAFRLPVMSRLMTVSKPVDV
ncbi:hypothetical protein Bca4012_070750 [Brassica carinata]|uniref:YTH domain-containing family protein n=1 Tax=Brassica carinata TaxID=52824 RepID=A0A8X7QE02_BRACI|nr:hypothetical protein Bca52824_063030 [Brassica carinata]